MTQDDEEAESGGMGGPGAAAGPKLLELTTNALKLHMRDPAPAGEENNSASLTEHQVSERMQAPHGSSQLTLNSTPT